MKRALPLLLLAACGGAPTQPTTPTHDEQPVAKADKPTDVPSPVVASSKPVTNRSLQTVGLDPNALDKSVDPCDDFYQFACGNWIKKTEIPADKPMAMRSFVDIGDRNLEYMHDMLEKARTSAGNDKLLAMAGSFYGSCMDEATIGKVGLRPLAPFQSKIASVKDAKSLSAAIAAMHAAGLGGLFRMGATQDSADATKMIAEIDQGGLGLPDRDYYLDANKKPIVEAYQKYVETLLVAAGHKQADVAKEATDVIGLETELAKVSKDKVARRDPKGMYNKIDRTGVTKAMSHFDWDTYWKTVGLPTVQDVTVAAPDFLSGVDKLITDVKSFDIWRNYLTVQLMEKTARFVTPDLEKAEFEFWQNLTGQKEMEPRWKRCVQRTDRALGDIVGQIFVRDRFGGDSKKAAEEEVHAVVGAMTANLAALPWMDDTTKKRANEKLTKMAYQIGYPSKWKTYDYKVDAKTWAANVLASLHAEQIRDLGKIGKPVDKDDWHMSTPTVNAYYDPSLNTMVFPAGILQPPFYSVDASIPVNLGAMGVVVGHELTHGFDDQGAQFDADGNLKDWWLPETETKFKARTKCVVDQYSNYTVQDVKVNGANTVGENIADIGGVKLALAAFRSMRSAASDTVVADGFTEDQQFFLGFGQAWCAKATPQIEKLRVATDPHSPAQWRVNGALQATPEFAKAFNCKAGQKMAPRNACVVW